MGSLDKAARTYAVPVRGTIWGLNYNDSTERDVMRNKSNGSGNLMSDMNDYFPGVFETIAGDSAVGAQIGASKICPIRILKPHYGEMTECFLDLDLTVASGDSDLTLKIGIGRLDSGLYSRVSTYTEDEINATWRKIRGTDAPLTVSGGKISADLLNLLPALPVYGSADYRRDVFVLVLFFNKVPTITGTFKFNYLNIHTAVAGVL